jgi:hypothetical protein
MCATVQAASSLGDRRSNHTFLLKIHVEQNGHPQTADSRVESSHHQTRRVAVGRAATFGHPAFFFGCQPPAPVPALSLSPSLQLQLQLQQEVEQARLHGAAVYKDRNIVCSSMHTCHRRYECALKSFDGPNRR